MCDSVVTVKAVVTTTIRLRFDGRSTAIKGHQGHSDVTRAADPLAAVALTYLFIYAAALQPSRDVVVEWS